MLHFLSGSMWLCCIAIFALLCFMERMNYSQTRSAVTSGNEQLMASMLLGALGYNAWVETFIASPAWPAIAKRICVLAQIVVDAERGRDVYESYALVMNQRTYLIAFEDSLLKIQGDLFALAKPALTPTWRDYLLAFLSWRPRLTWPSWYSRSVLRAG